MDADDVKYECKFKVPNDFGEIGGVKVENEHHNEMFFKTIQLDGFPNGSILVNCESWVDSHRNNSDNRFFFTNKVSIVFLVFIRVIYFIIIYVILIDAQLTYINVKS